ncbi:MAG: iron transporter, partial [Oscillospiraceae bacterium]|nr:iron transporter [Oscillospiraceae bacterium]
PAELTIQDGAITAKLVWSSSNYDYMIVDGEKYTPETLDPGSTFSIPVSGLDEEIAVTADTTAMSTPYEIEYTLRFDSSSLTPAA